MKIKFKDGKEIEFKQFDNIWLAESVIWKKTCVHGSFKELRELKAKINKWFKENAPEEISDRLNARLPLWKEIKALPFKDQVAYREGRTDQIADYFLGDEDNSHPVICSGGDSDDGFGRCFCYGDYLDFCAFSVRLCLEESK